ncbi:YncE family protein [Pigmentiphaga kullae]|uniref:YncE family protein n=1 Tax=Pigmentiphaga kullae TaxID=151784 RepID=UPI00102D2459|nr:hypothetical protein [Pigmentiphaga kullae]
MLPTLSEDSNPTGPRLDLGGRDYFPLNAGDSWVFSSSEGSTLTRRVTNAAADGKRDLEETDSVAGLVSQLTYSLSADGVVVHDPAGAKDDLPELYRVLPSLIEYPVPFYPVDGVRRIVRQGNAGVDLDGDGKSDFYRFSFEQVFKGFKGRTVMGRTVNTAHYSSTATATVQLTGGVKPAHTVVAQEEVYLAAGVGPVYMERSAKRETGEWKVAPHTLTLQSAVVGGNAVIFDTDGEIVRDAVSVTDISVSHNDLVYDRIGNVYYASVPAWVSAVGNRLAIISAQTGSVGYSPVVGSDPGALAVSASGDVLYVGLNGSGEVARFSLPEMTLIDRVKLPVYAFSFQTNAETISVSPIDSSVVVVSLTAPEVSPGHAGVVLIRNGVLQPRALPAYDGGNVVAFDPAGTRVWGLDAYAGSLEQIYRIGVRTDGLELESVVQVPVALPSIPQERNGMLLAGEVVLSAADLALQATLPASSICSFVGNIPRIVCVQNGGGSGVNKLNFFSDPYTRTGRLSLGMTADISNWKLVPGPRGQLAIRRYGSVTLVQDPLLE